MIQFGMATMLFGGEEIGCLQGVSLDFSFNTAELYCGNGIFPQDVRVHSGTITGNAEFADLTATAFEKILGGTRVNDTISLTESTKPSTFAMVTTLVTDGVSFVVTFPAVRSTKLSLAFVRDGHLIPNFDFSIEADANGSVATIDVGDVS
jgi:hypothetical protein